MSICCRCANCSAGTRDAPRRAAGQEDLSRWLAERETMERPRRGQLPRCRWARGTGLVRGALNLERRGRNSLWGEIWSLTAAAAFLAQPSATKSAGNPGARRGRNSRATWPRRRAAGWHDPCGARCAAGSGEGGVLADPQGRALQRALAAWNLERAAKPRRSMVEAEAETMVLRTGRGPRRDAGSGVGRHARCCR